MLVDAMCRSRFSIFFVKGRHPAAGLILKDLLGQQEVWLVDEGFEQTMPDGAAFASRVIKPDDFHMTTGAAIPITREAMEDVAAVFPTPALSDGTNVKFIEAVYRAAIKHRLMDGVVMG